MYTSIHFLLHLTILDVTTLDSTCLNFSAFSFYVITYTKGSLVYFLWKKSREKDGETSGVYSGQTR